MTAARITKKQRRFVVKRADSLCEYCLIDEQCSFLGFEVDHIISEKHGGRTVLDNLALACVFCNRHKGSDVGSIHWESNEFVRLFHPRTDHWRDHFELVGARIEGLTLVGKVTARLLGWNSANRVEERELLIRRGFFPTEPAKTRM